MKRLAPGIQGFKLFLLSFFVVLTICARGQENSVASPPLPGYINNIVSVSCMPCHSSTGGILSRSKLNFNEWTEYSLEKQTTKAQLMYKKLKKNEMPPKSARENNPDIILTGEQMALIKSWADSLKAATK